MWVPETGRETCALDGGCLELFASKHNNRGSIGEKLLAGLPLFVGKRGQEGCGAKNDFWHLTAQSAESKEVLLEEVA